jgi:thioesterase III
MMTEMNKKAIMHLKELRVRGFHLDIYQHVNNARYLEFLEEARWQFFDDMALTPLFCEAMCAMGVINININYRHSAYFGDDLLIGTYFSKVQSRKAILTQVIRLKNTDQVIAEAVVTFIGFDQQTKKAISFPPDLRKKMQTLLLRT